MKYTTRGSWSCRHLNLYFWNRCLFPPRSTSVFCSPGLLQSTSDHTPCTSDCEASGCQRSSWTMSWWDDASGKVRANCWQNWRVFWIHFVFGWCGWRIGQRLGVGIFVVYFGGSTYKSCDLSALDTLTKNVCWCLSQPLTNPSKNSIACWVQRLLYSQVTRP